MSRSDIRRAMRSFRYTITDCFLVVIAAAYLVVTRCLPRYVAQWTGLALSRAVWVLARAQRRRGMENLELAFGDDLSHDDKRRILKASFENLGIVLGEFSRTPSIPERGPEWLRLTGTERVDHKRGAIVVSAHLANWEWLAPGFASFGHPVAEVVRGGRYPRFDRLVNRVRERGGIEVISREQAGPRIRELLRNGTFVGILVDQCPKDTAVPATFFGRECWATTGPALLALRNKAPICVTATIREPDGSYTLSIAPVDVPPYDGDLEAYLLETTQRVQDAVESLVRQYPGQWVWTYDRWKQSTRLQKRWRRRQARANTLSGDSAKPSNAVSPESA